MKTFAITHTGHVREENEDRYIIKTDDDGAVLLAVADGMGGEAAGMIAADMLMDKLVNMDLKAIDNEVHLSRIVNDADRALVGKVIENSHLDGMGSTITCGLLRNGELYWAHVGDSRLFVLRNQSLMQITKDQNMVQFLLEEGEINAEEARDHPAQNQLDQCVGCGDCKPDTGRLALKAGDLLMLSTDGLHGEVSEDFIASTLTAPIDIENKAKSLIESALEEGGKDNMTIVIAEV